MTCCSEALPIILGLKRIHWESPNPVHQYTKPVCHPGNLLPLTPPPVRNPRTYMSPNAHASIQAWGPTTLPTWDPRTCLGPYLLIYLLTQDPSMCTHPQTHFTNRVEASEALCQCGRSWCSRWQLGGSQPIISYFKAILTLKFILISDKAISSH